MVAQWNPTTINWPELFANCVDAGWRDGIAFCLRASPESPFMMDTPPLYNTEWDWREGNLGLAAYMETI